MPKILELHPVVRGWLFDGPLAEHVPAFVARLREGRYAANTIARSLAAVAHFAHWMALSHLLAERLDESRVEQFLHEHSLRCEAAGRGASSSNAAVLSRLTLSARRADGGIQHALGPQTQPAKGDGMDTSHPMNRRCDDGRPTNTA